MGEAPVPEELAMAHCRPAPATQAASTSGMNATTGSEVRMRPRTRRCAGGQAEADAVEDERAHERIARVAEENRPRGEAEPAINTQPARS